MFQKWVRSYVKDLFESYGSHLFIRQVKFPLTCIPEPGTFVCVSEIVGGHKDSYRAQVLSTEHAANGSFRAHVFAVDNGFTTKVSGKCLYVLPEELLDIAPQVCLLIWTKPDWYIK